MKDRRKELTPQELKQVQGVAARCFRRLGYAICDNTARQRSTILSEMVELALILRSDTNSALRARVEDLKQRTIALEKVVNDDLQRGRVQLGPSEEQSA